MGNFLKVIGDLREVNALCGPLLNMSISKIKELHGSFKSICDNFAINLTDFETIFIANEQYFAVWDTDNNGVIEALEIFTGIIIHADAKAEDKIRFLFDLFDFNEIQSLSAMDFEFCLQCVVIATCKIFDITFEINEIEITTLVRQTFNDGIRITLPQLLKWTSQSQEIKSYFSFFRMDGPDMISIQTLSLNELITYEKFQSQLTAGDEEERNSGENQKSLIPLDGSGRFQGKAASKLTTNRRALYFRAWLTTAIQPLISYRLESKTTISNYSKIPDELKVKLEWVYGIRSSDTRRAVQYTVGQLAADTVGARDNFEKQIEQNNEEIVYFVASVVILLNTNVKKQRFYLSHEQEVISVAVSTLDGQYIASGELAINPAIHIWSRKSLESLSVIKGLHAQGVHLLQFTNDNKFLVTCGLTNPSAVIIYDWLHSEVVISTSIHAPTQEIFSLFEVPVSKEDEEKQEENLQIEEDEEAAKQQRPKSGIVVVSLREVVIFTVTQGTFSQSYLPFDAAYEDSQVSHPICAMTIIADYKNAFFKSLDMNVGSFRHLFLTGHKDGRVLIWRSDAYIGILCNYKDEITCMTKCYEGVAICTWRGKIYLWDDKLHNCTRTIELSSLPFKILSFHIAGVDYNQKRLLVYTVEGDVIQINLTQSGGANSNLIKAKRFNCIVKIVGQQRALSILTQDQTTIVIGGEDGLITSYDLESHELTDVWAAGVRVTAIATLCLEDGGSIIAAGTNVGNLIIRQDWEEIVPRYHACGSKTINDLQFSKNGLLLAAASSDKHVYLFQYQDGDYGKLAAVKLENGFPISVNFSYDSKKIVVCTNQRKLILLDPSTFILMFKPEDLSLQFWSQWIGRYPLVTKSQASGLIPICLAHKSNIVAAGDENGNIYLWRDSESIKDHIGINLTGHASSLQRICFTDDDKHIISLAANDNCLFQWKVTHVEQKLQLDKKETKKNASDVENKIIMNDDSLINELNFCFVKSETEEEIETKSQRQIVDNGLLLRGCNNMTMNRLGAKLNFDFEENTWKRPPAVALVLDHIYGVQTSDRRNTVIYMHFYEHKNPQKVNETNNQSATNLNKSSIGGDTNQSRFMKGPSFQNLLNENNKIEYDVQHHNCEKNLVFFTSRFGILYSQSKNAQTFYQGHSLKISCIQKHPFRKLIATGEVSSSPNIHIWDAKTLEPIVVLDSSHQGGILHLAFSPDGKKLVSVGMDRVYSIQVFQWEQNRTIAFRNLGYYPVFGLKFYPFENSRFITCGYEHMAIWQLQGNHMTCQVYQKYECQKFIQVRGGGEERLRSVLLCIEFLNFRLGHSIQSDILFGTSQGEITTYCAGKHFVLKDNAHKGSVNCIRVSDRLNDTLNIITGGEDGLIKIWDTSMILLQTIDMRQVPQMLKDLKNQRCYGIQSIEMYCCDRMNPRRLLVGLRCGEILEAVISDLPEKIQQQQLAKKAANAIGKTNTVIPAMLNFEFYTFVSAHSSLNLSQNQKKISCVVMPTIQVLASVADDETLRFWDLQKKKILVSKYLGAQATALAFSPDGTYLVIGLINGVMLVLESKIGKMNFGSYMEEYSLPTLDVKMSPKEAKATVIAIKFSFRGDFLAISFNNESRQEHGQANSKAAELGALEPSFVMIYVNSISHQNPDQNKQSSGGDPYLKFMKLVLPLASFQSNKVLRMQLAVTQLDFSECDQYLQLCVQRVSHESVIETAIYNQDDNVFVVWDIKNNTMVTNLDTLKSTKWPNWSMAPAINARFQGSEIDLQDPIEERQLLYRELCYMSKVSRFTLMDNAICGSQLGGLYLFRFPALTIEKLKVQEFRFDFIRKKEMAATRCFSGHTSMIQSIEIFQDKMVMSTSISDQCIVQWRVEYEDQHWELDFNNFLPEVSDPFNEYMNRIRFDKLRKNLWNTRLQVSEVNQGVSKKEFTDPACEMELQNVVGRRAYDRRGNLKIDCMDRISYQASSLQVFLTENDDIPENQRSGKETLIKQVFLRPDGNKFKTLSPELSCFCLSKDLRILFCATAQIEANVYIWEVTTNMKLGGFAVPNVPIINVIRVSHDNKLVLFLGQTKEFFQVISMVDWTKQNKVLFTRQFLHSLYCKIRDIDFIPESSRTFITSGIQHLCFWRLSGSNLEYQVGELTIPKAFATIGSGAYSHNPANQGKFGLSLVTDELQQQMFLKQSTKQDDDLENLFVTFLCISFIGATLITSGDDGFLYLWDRERIVRRILAHESSIFALHSNPKLGLIVSGGMEGIVTLWRLLVEQKSNVKSLERLRICNLRKNLDPHQAVFTPECNVQSVCLGFNRIVVGMRTGSIFEVIIKNEKKSEGSGNNEQVSDTKRWIRCADHEAPKSAGIDLASQRIFTITENGLFSVWDLKTFDVVYQKNFSKKTRNLQIWCLSYKVMLVFNHEIIVCDSDPKTNKFEEKADYSLILNQITYATLNQNEQILGVATISASAPEVTLYSTDGGGFMKLKQIFGFKSAINYLDFSTDNGYMQVEDKIGEVTLYEIETDRPIKTDAIDFELEWCGDGLRTWSRLKGVRHQYNNNNKIVKVKKLFGKPIVIIADEMGTIRLFNYPNVKGEPYYQSYSDHLFALSDCMVSPDRLYLITSCEADRCIFKWKLKFNEPKIQLMLEEDMKKLNEITVGSKQVNQTVERKKVQIR